MQLRLPQARRRPRRAVTVLLAAALVVATPAGARPARVAHTSGATVRTDPPHWSPAAGTTWQWQLTGHVDTSVNASVYDIDLFESSARVVDRLHDLDRKVICYVSVGSYEDWRPDADLFPASVLGRSNGWPGERWLDIRKTSLLAPILRARLDLCARKGFDAVEPDNVDGYTNRTGFPLTGDDQVRFNRWIARLAHARGLGVALKNDPEQASALEPSFDFAVVEQCFEYRECGRFRPFARAGKAVLHVEYRTRTTEFCDATTSMGFSSMRKHYALGAWRKPC